MVKDSRQDLDDSLFLLRPEDEEQAAANTLSFSRSPTVLLTFAANRFTRNAARNYQQSFDIGSMDWRMLVMLAREPNCSVSRASQVMGIDKAAVSRSLQRLEKEGLVQAVQRHKDERRKEWALTKAGLEKHNAILPVALERQRQLLRGFSVEEVAQFNDFLRRFLTNLEDL